MVDLQAPVSFFDITPIGRILNRFSSDVFSVDDTLPFILNIFLAQAFSLLGVIVICIYGLPYIVLLIAPLTVIYYFIQVSCCFSLCISWHCWMSSDLQCSTEIHMSPSWNVSNVSATTFYFSLRLSDWYQGKKTERVRARVADGQW